MAKPGDLDTGFGVDGVVISAPTLSGVNALALQPDGKMVVAGEGVLARFHQNGEVDNSFGTRGTGEAKSPFGALGALLVQPDGTILTAGETAIARYTTDGQLDAGFGDDGKVLLNLQSNRSDAVQSLVRQPDGKFIAAGVATVPGNRGVFFLVSRYQPVGIPDVAFGNGGTVTVDFGEGLNVVFSAAVDAAGRILVAGGALRTNRFHFAVARLTPGGALDDTFGDHGKVITTFEEATFSQINSLAVQADGKIVAVGTANGPNQTDVALVRYHSNGTLDESFGTAGLVRTDFQNGSRDTGFALSLQPDGKLLVLGNTAIKLSKSRFILARYTMSGELDPTFGNGGSVLGSIGDIGGDHAQAIALQPDGRVIIGGRTNDSEAPGAVLARFHAVNLAVLQTAMPQMFNVGDEATYEIRIENYRLDAVTGVRVINTVPISVSFVSARTTQGACTNVDGVVICDLGSIASGSPATVRVVGEVKSTAYLCNTSIVEANETDSAITNSGVACAAVELSSATPMDLAVTQIKAPRSVVLTTTEQARLEWVVVQLQNRSPHPETISSLEGVVDLEVRSLSNACPDRVAALVEGLPQRTLPVTLAPKEKLNVYFSVSFSSDCVPDPMASTGKARHTDYSYRARVNHPAVDDNLDTHPEDDVCPRDPLGSVPNPNGSLKDRGCGGKRLGGVLGAPVVTDVIVR